VGEVGVSAHHGAETHGTDIRGGHGKCGIVEYINLGNGEI